MTRKRRFLLLQARDSDDPMRANEVECFCDTMGIQKNQVEAHDMLLGPPHFDTVRKFSGLLFGGSGDYYVSKGNLPYLEETCEFVRIVVSESIPTFASCFGFQLIVQSLGGTIIHDIKRAEVGSAYLELTEEGKQDLLFRALPSKFVAQMGHKDRAISYPPELVNLAFNDCCPFQAFRVKGKLIWGTQFHPELDLKANRARVGYYNYVGDSAIQSKDSSDLLSLESLEASQLLKRFSELLPS